MIVGIDEVGRGPVAGPVVVCGMAFPPDFPVEIKGQLNDSKKLSKKKRELLEKILKDNNVIYYLAERPSQDIDKLGIAICLRQCVEEIVNHFICHYSQEEPYFILDGNQNYLNTTHGETRIKADASVPECMGASILAKVYRDNIMNNLHMIYDVYNWNANSGYGTKAHMNAISNYGQTEYHRKSFLKKINKS